MKDFITVGRIINTHGLKGELKVYPLTDDSNRFKELKSVYVDGILKNITGCKLQSKKVILKSNVSSNTNEIKSLKSKINELQAQLQDLLNTPLRQLSLGQKMRCEIAGALLHSPKVLYLDEPTIGLDVLVKSKIRSFIKEINQNMETTVILTTHDMDDIEQICKRLIMIDNGHILYDGPLLEFKMKFGGENMLVVDFADEQAVIDDPRLKLIKEEGPWKSFLFSNNAISVAEAITLITRKYDITDLNLKEPQIEGIVKKIYENKGFLVS